MVWTRYSYFSGFPNHSCPMWYSGALSAFPPWAELALSFNGFWTENIKLSMRISRNHPNEKPRGYEFRARYSKWTRYVTFICQRLEEDRQATNASSDKEWLTWEPAAGLVRHRASYGLNLGRLISFSGGFRVLRRDKNEGSCQSLTKFRPFGADGYQVCGWTSQESCYRVYGSKLYFHVFSVVHLCIQPLQRNSIVWY